VGKATGNHLINIPKNMAVQLNEKANNVNGVSSQAGDAAFGSGKNKVPKVVIKRKPCTETLKIGTWNVRTMLRKGKLENVKQEMNRNKINILGISEVRWKDVGDFESDSIRVIYSGGKESQRGVAILLDSTVAKRVTRIIQHSDRLVMVKVQAEPTDLVIIQVYMPTTGHDDEEVDNVYEELENIIDEQKGNDNVVIMGDWNAVVGEGKDQHEIGDYGLGLRNERGEKLVNFCRRQKLMATNTWFQQQKRRRYTWKMPGDNGRYQLDYILIRQRYRNGVKNSKTYPGADADTDHNLVAMKLNVKFKIIAKGKKHKKWNIDRLKIKEEDLRNIIEKEIKQTTGNNVEDIWNNLKTTVREKAEDIIGYKKMTKVKKPWVTSDMMTKMEQRRRWKNVNTDFGKKMYRQMNNELRRETDRARERWWEEECGTIEEMNNKGRSDLMYAKVKQLTWNKNSYNRIVNINDGAGKMLEDPAEIKKRWKEYIEQLYDRNGKPSMEEMSLEEESNVQKDFKGPDLIKSEILSAIAALKKKKAVGMDEIPAEFLKIIGDKALNELVRLCKEMYNQGVWPKDFTQIVMIPLPKKTNATECADHRTISLVPHASKIMLKILTKRIESKVEGFIGKNQFGFRKGRGTRDAIGVLRMLCERSIENDNDIYICFVDFEKAFDRVNWVIMMDILKNLGVDWRDRKLITDLYMRQEAVIRIDEGESEPGVIGRGVRQGCPLSPLLFSIYAEMMMKEAMEDMEEGVKVGGEYLRDVKFADDQAIVSSTELGLQRLINALQTTASRYDMKINVKKTKTLLVSKQKTGGKVDITIYDQKVEQVTKFKYLGALISEDGRCESEVKVRIGMGKDAFSKRKELLTKNFSRNIKIQIVKAVVWSVALYGCETWTLRKTEIQRLEAFEMWIWRRMEKIGWTEKKTNAEVLKDIGQKRNFITTILKRKKNWIGHVLRHEGLMRDVMEGKMEGKRSRGRVRFGMIDEIKEGGYASMKKRAQDRVSWRSWMPRTCLTAENS
jgi:hypothetical protein